MVLFVVYKVSFLQQSIYSKSWKHRFISSRWYCISKSQMNQVDVKHIPYPTGSSETSCL